MEALYSSFYQTLESTPMDFFRDFHSSINWDCRVIGLIGQKGIGKSTLLLQHIKKYENLKETLYVSADDIYFSAHTLLETAKSFYANGGKVLFIDEIHKYKEWSTEIKNIYDSLPYLRVIYSGSSILDLEKGGADLSRRAVEYHMPVLSFREFLNIRNGWNLQKSTLDQILNGKVDFPYGEHRPLAYFKEYIRIGCYPYFREPEQMARMRRVINTTVESDIPKYAGMTLASSMKLKKFLYYISQSVPVKINFTDMARDLEMDRNDLPQYLEYLEKAELVSVLRMKANGDAILRKMDKLYLHNPNMMYTLVGTEPNSGNVRETIFLCWTKYSFDVVESPVSDFEIDGLTFEVGGRKKGKKQIESVEKGYIVADDIEYAYQNKIPIWMFGFLY
ncbi:MAG: AAA family ATPase [Bacteroidales bacterium]|nr:AAA family ATPase [Bacteroidales bacterium]